MLDLVENQTVTEITVPKSCTHETVTAVTHWSDSLFSFRLTRPASFRFRAGEFVMIGLLQEGKPILRAYSIASPTWDEELEFYSIKAPGGKLTTQLQHIKSGDKVLLGRKPTGTLVTDALLPGKRLYMLSTGTGLAPFASLVREPDVYEQFDEIIVTHTCRTKIELSYGETLINRLREDPLVGDMVAAKLKYFASVTRDDEAVAEGAVQGRITDLIHSGSLFEALDTPRFSPEHDRIMICGSEAMLKELKQISLDHGFSEGSNAAPAQFVIEKAFVGDGV